MFSLDGGPAGSTGCATGTLRILFCSSTPLDARLGTAKAVIEVASHMEALGWSCRLVSAEEIQGFGRGSSLRPTLEAATGRFVEHHAGDFDVVEFDQFFLPFPRTRFCRSTLLVARSALLHHHLTRIKIPRPPGLRPLIGSILKGPFHAGLTRLDIRQSTRTLEQADLVNVNNDYDRIELGRRGFDLRKLVVIPLGLGRDRLASLGESPSHPVGPPRLAFIGGFERRKGAYELPEILREVDHAIPGSRLRLLGTGLDADSVRRAFGELAPQVEVYPVFQPDSLPALLRDCSLGVFPSYLEGFGFGVLEMLAASLPVFAYDAPGPPMMLCGEYLAPRGHARELARRAVSLLRRPEALRQAQLWARRRAAEFTWESAARTTSDVYAQRVARLRDTLAP
jgi:glycosyltransferase involved in cell wall biosynthesis